MHITAHRKRTQERRGRHERRHAEFRTDAGHGLHVGRVGHRHNRAAFREVQEGRHREAEAVEQREFREHHVGAGHVENTGELLDVAHEVSVTQHHALRGTFGTRTEHDGRNIVELDALAEAELDEPARRKHTENKIRSDFRLRDFLHEIFGVEDAQVLACNLGIVVAASLEFLDEHAARDDGLHVGAGGAVLHVVHGRGVVQVHVRLA